MALQLPQNRLAVRQTQPTKRNIPLEQIVQAEGQNPVAAGVQELGTVIGQTLQKRAELQRQGQQLAQLEKLGGVQPGSYTGLTPDQASPFAMATMKQGESGKKKPLQGTYTDPATKKVYQPFYDEKSDKIDYQELKGPQQLAQRPGGTGTMTLWQNPDTKEISAKEKKGWLVRNVPEDKGTALLATSYNQDANRARPTASTRSSAEFATTIIPHIDNLRNLIAQADAKGYIGPASGRVYGDFMAGRVGSTGDPEADQLLGQLRATDSLMKTGAMRVHFGARGGQQMYDHFSDLLNTGRQSAAMLNGSLDGIESFMQGYADAGKPAGSLSPIQATPKTLSMPNIKDSIKKKLGL